ncbi:MAG: hypothetical protein HY875_12885 [Chloroflexi bacterium]|nr:hypothetical protein [Chloroflexota bacterium]
MSTGESEPESSDASLERTLDAISVRMAAVLRFVAEGHTQAEITKRSGVPRETVRDYVRQLEQLTGSADMGELGSWWLEHRSAWARQVAARAGAETPAGARRRPALRRATKANRRARTRRPRLREAAGTHPLAGGPGQRRRALARMGLTTGALFALPLLLLVVAIAIAYGQGRDETGDGTAVSASPAASDSTVIAPLEAVQSFDGVRQGGSRVAVCADAGGSFFVYSTELTFADAMAGAAARDTSSPCAVRVEPETGLPAPAPGVIS